MADYQSPVKRFFDQSYENRLQELSLQMQCSKNFLYLSYFHNTEQKIVGIEEYVLGEAIDWEASTTKLIELFKSAPTFQKNYYTTSFSIIDPCYCLVPSELFEEEVKIEQLRLNFKDFDEKQFKVAHHSINSFNAELVYGIPLNLMRALESQFSGIQIGHYACPLLEGFALNRTNPSELSLHIQYDHFDLIYFAEGKLQFFNSFKYSTAEDFIYYLLYALEQLKLDRDKSRLVLNGEIEEKSSIYDLIYQYIRYPELGERNKSLHTSQIIKEIPSQYYYNLFNQQLCE